MNLVSKWTTRCEGITKQAMETKPKNESGARKENGHS